MLLFLKSHIIYSYNDMSHFFIRSLGIYNTDPLYWGYTDNTGDPSIALDHLSLYLLNFLHRYIHPIVLNNLLIIFFFLLSLFIGYKLFRLLDNTRYRIYPLLFSFLYASSTYFIFRVVSSTASMYSVFVFPLLFILLKKEVRPYFIGLFIFLVLMLSNYYGFFALITAGAWCVSGLLFEFNRKNLFNVARSLVLMFLALFIPVVLFFSSQFMANLPIFGGYERSTQSVQQKIRYRPIEDFYNFSFRPWYFVIPPKSSVFFGQYSREIYARLESTGNYLLNDYTEDEAAGSFMGWHFVAGVFFVAFLLTRSRVKSTGLERFENIRTNRGLILRLFFLAFVILAITMPPSITIKGIPIYTPSYLLYYLVPVFRTMVRWSVVIYLIVLCINYFLFLDILSMLKKKVYRGAFLVLFMLFNFVSFAVHIPVQDISNPPEEIAFLVNIGNKPVPYAVYPKGDYYSTFWVLAHENYLVNPVNLVNVETGFNSNEFTQMLTTEQGIDDTRAIGVEYLVYYPNRVQSQNDNNKETILDFFISNVGEPVYSSSDVYIFKLSN